MLELDILVIGVNNFKAVESEQPNLKVGFILCVTLISISILIFSMLSKILTITNLSMLTASNQFSMFLIKEVILLAVIHSTTTARLTTFHSAGITTLVTAKIQNKLK